MKPEMQMGVQPLDQILESLKLKNSQLVEVSKEQLTHKIVQKGRKGRRLTINAQMKILNALNAVQTEKQFVLKDLFNYEHTDCNDN